MKQVLILNGSPQKAKSNTLKITQAFVQGMQSRQKSQIHSIDLYDNNIEIKHCIGCFQCWTKTPGVCIFYDSMPPILEALKESDIVIWSFPLYYFGLPSKAKACMDRLLPLNEPFMTTEKAGHTPRYELGHQKNVVISSGGLSTVEHNFEALEQQFQIMGENHGGAYTCLFMAQSPLLGVPELKATTERYLEQVAAAGTEFAEHTTLSQSTRAALQTPLFPIETYNQMADSSWDIATTEENSAKPKLFAFTKQMAALYNPHSYQGDLVLEIEYTDYEETYQMVLAKTSARVLQSDFLPYTTKIITPYSVWSDISKGNISGSAALMEGKYKVLGDLNVMMRWGDLFGMADQPQMPQKTTTPPSKTSMNMMLIAWIIMWVALPLSPLYGAVGVLAFVLLLPVICSKLTFTAYDKLSALLTGCLALCSLLGVSFITLSPISYLLFALLWLGSLVHKIPLSAHYSNVDFGGEAAFQNPIFIKTNAILTACWGILYVAIALFTFFAVRSPIQPYLVMINNLPPILLGIFTHWFRQWYPQYIMSGK